ncbi:MAG: hypothetical protein PWQ89_520, partial [Verrucomicrobiota bacterium]|nr:hypothetical protein [Verrucomicrobiota bacterium]
LCSEAYPRFNPSDGQIVYVGLGLYKKAMA